MNARTVRKAISVALLTAAVGLVFEHGSATRAQQPSAFGKAFANNPRPPKSATPAKKGKPKVEVTPNPESPYYNGGGQGYVATPPAVPAAQPAVAIPAQYRPGTAPGAPVGGPGTLSLQQQQMQAQQMRAAEQYAQQQAAQQQMAQQQRLAQQQLTGQVAGGQAPAGQAPGGQIPGGQPAPPQFAAPQQVQYAPQPQTAPAPVAGSTPDSSAAVHDYVAEMYRRDGRDIAQWDYQAMGYNPQPVYKQQGAQGANAPRQPSFLQRWVPGYSKLFPGKREPERTQPAQTAQYPAPPQAQPGSGQPGYAQGAPAQSPYQQPAQPQYAQPQYAQPQYAQPNYGQPQVAQPAPQLLPQGPAPQVAGPARPGMLAPGGQSTSPLVGRVGVPVAQPGVRAGTGQPVLTPPPALAARPGAGVPLQPLPQPEIPGVAPSTNPAAPGPQLELAPPANVAATPPATPPSNTAAPQLPVLDIVSEPAPKTAAAAPAKSLENDLFLDEADADRAEAGRAEAQGSLVLSDDKPKTGTPEATPMANAPLLADEPVDEKPQENPYTGRRLEIDERVAVVLPNPAASLLDDEEDEDRRMLLADASPGLATVSAADNTPPAPLPTLDAPPAVTSTGDAGELTPPAIAPDVPANDREETERPKLAARPALKGFKGFCPVTLRNSRRLVEAKLEYSSEYAGQSYQFATAEAKAEFDAAPDRFVPAKGGRDVVQASAASEAQEGSLDHAVWYRGKLYLFATPATREQFVVEPAKFAVP